MKKSMDLLRIAGDKSDYFMTNPDHKHRRMQEVGRQYGNPNDIFSDCGCWAGYSARRMSLNFYLARPMTAEKPSYQSALSDSISKYIHKW
jgi:hypothetical protein